MSNKIALEALKSELRESAITMANLPTEFGVACLTEAGAQRIAKALTDAATAMEAGGWLPIESAPKSIVDGGDVHGIYLLGYCPEPDACNLESCISVVWWEPLMNGGKGMWYGEGGYRTRPTHWMPLPTPPKD